jgi:cell shape-determining protein MreC
MKMRFLKRRNALLTPQSLSAGTAVLAIAILLVVVRFFLPGFFVLAVSPLWNVGTYMSSKTRAVTESFASATAVGQERDQLASENATLMLENSALTAKVNDLTSLIGTRPPLRPGILAGVLARPPFSSYDTLIIDEGSAAEVRVGAMVTATGGVPVGTIASVTGDTARVVLLSAPGTKTGGWIGEARTPVTLTGEGAGAFSLSVSKDIKIAVGDLVYVPSNGAVPIASVARLDTDPSSAFVEVQLRPVVNPFSILWVEVSKMSTP